MNILRDMFARRVPDFYGDGQQAQGPSVYQRGQGMSLGGRPDADDGMGGSFNPELRNYLLKFMRG